MVPAATDHLDLQSGGTVLMIRHAYAPGNGDPPGFRLNDCATQRNLNAEGRSQARGIGDFLRREGIRNARVFSSQWCRCLETARLMNMGPVEPLPALNSFYGRPEDRPLRMSALETFLAAQPRDGALIIMVTHFVTISALTGEGVSSGEGVVLRLEKDDHRVMGRLDFTP